MKNLLGIIGGLGPMAGAYFLELLTAATDADRDQDHAEAILYSHPDTPDRTEFIIGESTDDPTPYLLYAAQQLEKMGVANIAIPCVASHYFLDEVEKNLTVPVLHMPELTTQYIQSKGMKKVGIMATTGTVKTGLFQNKLDEAGIEWAIPSDELQDLVMEITYGQIKAGKRLNNDQFIKIIKAFLADGCEGVILGSTELSVANRSISNDPLGKGILDTIQGLQIPLIDSMDILAVESARVSGVKVRRGI
ncbi:MAG: amino acid racemase [Clostridiales Family XIII bacterium]|nr:amino acid racemase [Clostridiales Family XIII bacterium]